MRHQPGVAFGKLWLEFAQDAHPNLDILALGPADLAFGGGRQIGEVAVLDPDEVRFAQSEVEMKVDQAVQCRGRVGLPRPDLSCAGEKRVLMPTNNSTSSDSLLGKCR